MNRAEVEREIAVLSRTFRLGGPEPADHTLLDYPACFDSLTFIRFLTAVENHFEIELSDSIWQTRQQLRIRELSEIVCAARARDPVIPEAAAPADRTRQAASQSPPIVPSRISRSNFCSRVVRRVSRVFRQRRQIIVLAKDLDQTRKATHFSQSFVLRRLRRDDAPLLTDLWPSAVQKKMHLQLQLRIKEGFVGLIAIRGTEAIGMDWLSAVGEDIPELGLRLRTDKDTCYGFDLYEKYSGEGIGLALLQYSLEEAKLLGFRRQVSYTTDDNISMLAAAVHLLGFKQIGKLERSRLLFSTRWHVHEWLRQDEIQFLV